MHILKYDHPFLKVARTPPDEKLRRQKEEASKNEELPSRLILVPFAGQPLITFDNIKLGHAAVRKLAIENTNSKDQIQVCIPTIVQI